MNSVGFFGGQFDPLHMGHIESIKNLIQEYKFDQLLLVPSFVSPGKEKVDSFFSAEERVELLKKSIIEFGLSSHVKIYLDEVEKGGVSYTVDSLKRVQLIYNPKEMFLVIGLDQFYNFFNWKSFDQILKGTHLVVTSRPGYEFPKSQNDWKDFPEDFIIHNEKREITHKYGNKIYFFQLENDVNISSTDIRKRIAMGQDIQGQVPESVKEAVDQKKKRYIEESKKEIDDLEFSKFVMKTLDDLKGVQVRGFDVSELTQPCDFVVIASGTSQKHTQSLADSLIRQVKKQYRLNPFHTDGAKEGQWVALDYGNVIVHIFYDYTRMEYKLEELWKDGKEIQL